MSSSRPNKIIGFITSTLVLIGGIYLVLFLTTGFSPLFRFIIGMFVIIYFLFRIKMIFGFSKREKEADRQVKRWE